MTTEENQWIYFCDMIKDMLHDIQEKARYQKCINSNYKRESIAEFIRPHSQDLYQINQIITMWFDTYTIDQINQEFERQISEIDRLKESHYITGRHKKELGYDAMNIIVGDQNSWINFSVLLRAVIRFQPINIDVSVISYWNKAVRTDEENKLLRESLVCRLRPDLQQMRIVEVIQKTIKFMEEYE